LPEPTGGYISYDASSETKTTALLFCFYGYLPFNNHNKRECRAESTSWTGEPFACIRKLTYLHDILCDQHKPLAQICGAVPSVQGANSTVVVTESPDGAFTVNTTVTFTCPDNTIQNSRCEYAPVGGAQWVGTLRECPVGKKYITYFNSYISSVLYYYF